MSIICWLSDWYYCPWFIGNKDESNFDVMFNNESETDTPLSGLPTETISDNSNLRQSNISAEVGNQGSNNKNTITISNFAFKIVYGKLN